MTTKGGRKREFRNAKAHQAYCREKAREGYINKADGGWRRAENSSADTMVLKGYHV